MRISKERRELIGGFTQTAVAGKGNLSVAALTEVFNETAEKVATVEEFTYALTRFIATTPKKELTFDLVDETTVVEKGESVEAVVPKEEVETKVEETVVHEGCGCGCGHDHKTTVDGSSEVTIGLMAEISAAVYGILNFEELATVMNFYFPEAAVTKEDMIPALTAHIELSGEEVGYTVFEGFVVHPTILPNADEVTDGDVKLIDQIREEQGECARYLPPFETLVEKANTRIFSLGASYDAFRAFLTSNIKKLGVTEAQIDQSLETFFIFSKAGLTPDRFIEFFKEEGFKFVSKVFSDAFFNHAVSVYAQIRLYSFNGFTPLELQANPGLIQSGEEVVQAGARTPRVNTVKVGRNEPCVCGSGKKYKKCCL